MPDPRRARPWGAPFAALGLACLAALSLGGCGQDAESQVDTPFPSFASGPFDVVTTLVDDGCLDGGLNPLFMPLGVDTPWHWPYPIDVYNLGELPRTYPVALREPFGEMTVTAQYTGGATQGMVADENQGVLLGEDRYGQCVVDLGATVHLEFVSKDHITGVATLEMRNPRGDERCPVGMPASCRVLLTIDATRSAGE